MSFQFNFNEWTKVEGFLKNNLWLSGTGKIYFLKFQNFHLFMTCTNPACDMKISAYFVRKSPPEMKWTRRVSTLLWSWGTAVVSKLRNFPSSGSQRWTHCTINDSDASLWPKTICTDMNGHGYSLWPETICTDITIMVTLYGLKICTDLMTIVIFCDLKQSA